jgi:hypothetical protein
MTSGAIFHVFRLAFVGVLFVSVLFASVLRQRTTDRGRQKGCGA